MSSNIITPGIIRLGTELGIFAIAIWSIFDPGFHIKSRPLTIAHCVLSHFLLIFLSGCINQPEAHTNILSTLESPIIFKGDDTTAYRDPAVLYHNNVFYLFFTLVITEDGKIYSYTAESHSVDLKNWSPEKILTVKDQSLNFSSPGNIIKYNNVVVSVSIYKS